ncbi:hypothetical protein BU25DRAFT_462951 [Macroventuria anomochaeta]|uniref:Uncharacterized protein n=1 Tax=Macroventuria anomochaeta TaxID=301207 RepID=A0ACB6RK95_9PLEO|nr:uncharacterized protein BU25DRAFT_462951 [Macroventuria anomochaeta]KAF2622416.1 hypothetical protein BU25DRAFT_462951 [Macroventuria anomochaeta]
MSMSAKKIPGYAQCTTSSQARASDTASARKTRRAVEPTDRKDNALSDGEPHTDSNASMLSDFSSEDESRVSTVTPSPSPSSDREHQNHLEVSELADLSFSETVVDSSPSSSPTPPLSLDDGIQDELETSKLIYLSDEDAARIKALIERYEGLLGEPVSTALEQGAPTPCCIPPGGVICTPSECSENLQACTPMKMNPDVDITFENREGLQTTYPVYTCHHTEDTDMIVLSQTVLAELHKVTNQPTDSKATYEQEIGKLKELLDNADPKQDAAVQGKEDAREPESVALEALKVAQEENEEIENVAETLRQQLSASECQNLTLESENESLKKQLRDFAETAKTAMIDLDTARSFLKTHQRDNEIAVAKIKELEDKIADLEQMLQVKLFATGRRRNGDTYVDMSSVDIEQEQGSAEADSGWGPASRWRLGNWRA